MFGAELKSLSPFALPSIVAPLQSDYLCWNNQKEAIQTSFMSEMGWSSMFVVTGNRLLDGIVVYLAAAHRWVEDLQTARLYETKEEAEAALQEQSDVIVSLDVIPVALDAGGNVQADRLRERIRSDGPTINPFETTRLERSFPAIAE